ncbi:MAG: hypothetical protein ACRDY2_00840 [Acidimicrobiales bacterium]
MPTSHPRHQVTETPAVAHAMDLAAQRWPSEPRPRLLLRLVHEGSAALERQAREAVDRRLDALDATSGKYADVFSEDYLDELRKDWPS